MMFKIPHRAANLLIAMMLTWLPAEVFVHADEPDGKSPRSFVPLEELDALTLRDHRGVLLTREEFRALRELAAKHGTTYQPPVPAVLSRCNYVGRVVGDRLLVTLTARLDQLSTDWQAWPLPLQRFSVESATVDGEAGLIGRAEHGLLTVFTTGKKSHTLQLELSTEIVALGSDQAAAFSLLPSSVAQFELTLPAGKRLLVDGADLGRPSAIEQPATYQLALGGKTQVQLRITDRASERRSDALAFATTGYGLTVSPGEVTWATLTSLQVFGRPVDRLRLSVPAALEIADVESTGLESWELQEDSETPDRTVITLTFGQPFEGARTIAVKGVMAVPANEAWSVPPLAIADVSSHIGQIVIEHPPGVRLQIVETEGARRATSQARPVSDMPETQPGGTRESLRFDAWRENFVLKVLTQPKPRELHAAIAGVLDVSSQIEFQGALTLTTRFAPLFDVDVNIPADWQVFAATTEEGQSLTWQVLPGEAGVNQVRVTLAKPLASGSSTVVRLQLRRELEDWPVETEAAEFNFPELLIPQAAVVETALVVRGDVELDLVATDVVGLDPAALKADWERFRFQSQDTRYSGVIKVTRKPSRIAAETAAYYRPDPQTLHSTIFANLSVEGGGLRQLEVSLPESVEPSVRFQLMGATLVEQQPLPVEDGRRRWRLQFARRLLGQALLFVQLEQPRTPNAEVSCPGLRIAQVDREFGAIVVEAGAEQKLVITAVDAQGDPLPEMDPLELPQMPYALKERMVGVYRTIGGGAAVTIAEQRFEKAALPTAVCTTMNVTTLLSKSGELQQRADLTLRLSGVQQLLVSLPEGNEAWGALLDGRPVELRKADAGLLVPVPSTVATQASVALRLFYRATTSELARAGRLEQAAPSVAILTGSGQTQPVEILEQNWRLIHPGDTLVIDSESSLEAVSQLDAPSWLTRAVQTASWPSTDMIVYTAAVTIGALVGWVVLMQIVRLLGRPGLYLSGALVLLIGMVGICLLPATKVARRAAPSATAASRDYAFTKAGSEQIFEKSSYENGGPADAAPKSGEWLDDVQDQRGLTSLERRLKDQEKGLTESKSNALPVPAAGPVGAAPQREMLDQNGNGIVAAQDAPAQPRMPGLANAPQAPQAAAPPPAAEPEMKNDDVALAGVPANRREDRQGLLSLALDLEAPAGSLEKSFRYLGSLSSSQGVPLRIVYLDRRGGRGLRVFAFVAGLLMGWWMRRSAWRIKFGLSIVLWMLSLGIQPLTPVEWQPVLDGLFLASIGMWICWTVCTVLKGLQQLCDRVTAASARIAGGDWSSAWKLVFAAMLVGISDLQAAEEPAKAKPLPKVPSEEVWIYESDQEPTTASKVYLPQEKYLELFQRAHPEFESKSPAPTAGGIADAVYAIEFPPSGEGADGAVLVRARYAIRSAVDGQLAVMVPLRSGALQAAKLNGVTAPLIVRDGGHVVLVPRAGVHVLDIEALVPARRVANSGSFLLNLLATPAGKLTLPLPDNKTQARVNGSTSIYRRITTENAARIELAVDQGGEFQMTWQPEQARAGAAVVHVDSTTAVTVVDAGVSISTGLRYRVRQGIIRDVSLALPEKVRLKSVSGPDVGGWEILGEGQERKLRIFLRRNVGDQTQLTVDGLVGESVAVESQLRITPLSPLEVTSEAGQFAIYADPHFAVRATNVSELLRVDTANFEPAVPVSRLDIAPQLAYRHNQSRWTADVVLTRLSTQLTAEIDSAVWITHRKVRTTTRLVVDLARIPRSSLSIKVPVNWIVLDVQSTGLRDWYRSTSDDGAILTLEYEQPRSGQLEIVVSASASRLTEGEESLGSASVVGTQRQVTRQALWMDAGLTPQVTESAGWQPVDVGTLPDQFKRLRADAPQLAFTSNATEPGPITVKVATLSPRLSGESLVITTVTDVAIVYGFVFQWRIAQAATETLWVDTPAWLSGRIQFEGAGLRDVSERPIDAETIRWTITLRGPVSGDYSLAAAASTPPSADRVISPGVKFVNDGAAGAPLETQRHFALLVNTSLSQLTALNPDLSEPVQREDVSVVVRQELVQQATEFVRLKSPGTSLAWSRQRYTPAANVPAAVNLADVLTVVARDGSYRTRITYSLKNRVRQFLAVRLPADTRLLAVMVSGVPSRAVVTTLSGGEVRLIALPKSSAVDLSFPIQIVYAGRLSKALPHRGDLVGTELDIPVAEVVGQDESAEYGIPVARTQWSVYLPSNLMASPLADPLRHNLNRASDDDVTQSSLEVLLSDAEGLVEVVGELNSSRGRQRAYQNLKQLSSEMDRYSSYGGRRIESESEELATRQKQVRESLSKLESSLAQQQDGEQFFSGATSGGAVQSNDTSLQWHAAISNNGILFFDNSSKSTVTNSTDDATLNFRFQAPAAGKPMSSGSPDQKPAGDGTKLEARQQYQRFNEDQLDRLNSAISTKRGFQVQDESGRRSGVNQSGPQRPAQAIDLFGNQNRAPSNGNGTSLGLELNRPMGSGGAAGPEAGPGGFAGQMGGMRPQMGQQVPQGDRDFDGVQQLDDAMAFDVPALNGRGEAVISAGWTQPGGLSMPIDLPTTGTPLRFSKAGGDARLGLMVRTEQAIGRGLGIVWAVTWAVLALLVLRELRSGRTRRLGIGLPWLIAAAAVIVLLLGPTQFHAISLIALVAALGIGCWWLVFGRSIRIA